MFIYSKSSVVKRTGNVYPLPARTTVCKKKGGERERDREREKWERERER